ncbi:MAG: hypothetical protein WBI68_05355, partial [Bacillota bacterium]
RGQFRETTSREAVAIPGTKTWAAQDPLDRAAVFCISGIYHLRSTASVTHAAQNAGLPISDTYRIRSLVFSLRGLIH